MKQSIGFAVLCIESNEQKAFGFAVRLHRIKCKKSIGFAKFCIDSNEKGVGFCVSCIGSNEKALVLLRFALDTMKTCVLLCFA